MTTALATAITTALEDFDACMGLAGPQAVYPITTFTGAGSQGNAIGNGFDADTETFLVQVQVFDDEGDGIRIMDTMSGAREAMKALRDLDQVVACDYVQGFGPTYIDTERVWQCTATFSVTWARDKTAS